MVLDSACAWNSTPTTASTDEHVNEEVWCHKNTFWQNDSVLNGAIFLTSCYFNSKGLDSACMGKSTCTRAHYM